MLRTNHPGVDIICNLGFHLDLPAYALDENPVVLFDIGIGRRLRVNPYQWLRMPLAKVLYVSALRMMRLKVSLPGNQDQRVFFGNLRGGNRAFSRLLEAGQRVVAQLVHYSRVQFDLACGRGKSCFLILFISSIATIILQIIHTIANAIR